MDKHLLNRRQFAARLGLLLPASSAIIPVQATAQESGAAGASQSGPRTVKFPDGTSVPAIGQGSWHLGQDRRPELVEEKAMRTGIDLGMTVIDTSENYGDGASEQFIGRVIAGQRDRVFLVSKVEPEHVLANGMAGACEASLARLGTDHLDLYLLHAPVPGNLLSGVVAEFEQLRAAGKIRSWGVSNFNPDQMEELFKVPDGHRCATNQVRYSLNYRSAQRDVLPWCQQHNMPVMAYSPLGGDDNLVLGEKTLAQIAAQHDCSPSAVALAWVIRSGNVIAIPESGSAAHVRENAAALSIRWLPPSP